MPLRISRRRFAAGALGSAAAALVRPGRARAASPFAFQASWANDAEFTVGRIEAWVITQVGIGRLDRGIE